MPWNATLDPNRGLKVLIISSRSTTQRLIFSRLESLHKTTAPVPLDRFPSLTISTRWTIVSIDILHQHPKMAGWKIYQMPRANSIYWPPISFVSGIHNSATCLAFWIKFPKHIRRVKTGEPLDISTRRILVSHARSLIETLFAWRETNSLYGTAKTSMTSRYHTVEIKVEIIS